MNIIKYDAGHKAQCIEIFESNIPLYFAPEELPPFKDFLDQDIDDNYYVIESEGKIVACGGIFLNEETDESGLSWGMVHAALHKKGIGRLLTEYRIGIVTEQYPGKICKIDTSQHTAGFYARKGFETIEIVANGFAPGLDKYVMKLHPR